MMSSQIAKSLDDYPANARSGIVKKPLTSPHSGQLVDNFELYAYLKLSLYRPLAGFCAILTRAKRSRCWHFAILAAIDQGAGPTVGPQVLGDGDNAGSGECRAGRDPGRGTSKSRPV